MTCAPLTVSLFGPPRVLVNGNPLPRVRLRAAVWLLSLLVLRHGRTVSRSWLAGTLWPESEETQALQNLRHALLELRKALGAEEHRIQSPTRDTLTLDLEGAEADVVEFDRAIHHGGAALRQAVAVYTGPLLEGCPGEWVTPERESRLQACLNALENLAAAAAKQQEYPAALSWLRRAEAMDPCRDSTQRGLMHVLAESGDAPAALLAYRSFRIRLREQMNLEPDPETTHLFHQILAAARERSRGFGPPSSQKRASAPAVPQVKPGGAPGADLFDEIQAPVQGAPAPLSPRPTSLAAGLPHPLTTLIGREQDCRAVAAAVAASRLVTLTGGGGVGKTRLAIHVARELAAQFPGGAAFVALASLAEPALLPAFVAAALGLKEEASPEPEFLFQSLIGWLSTHPLLLVLDNCEHLVDAVAVLAQALLERCPDLRILATSRQPLGLTGELNWRVPSLSMPDPDRLAGESDPVEAALRYPAVQLLMERAVLVRPGFRLAEPQEALTASRICRSLDGMPLAIELAASRLGLLNLPQIAARLDDRFRLLTTGSRGVAPRHQTLRALIDWSYDLLTAAEKTLFRRLSVFAGGWTLETAEAVTSLPDANGPRQKGQDGQEGLDTKSTAAASLHPAEVMDLLASLLDKSLILAEEAASGRRYRMLETVREYAREKLREGGEEEAARRAHCFHYLDLADASRGTLRGSASGTTLDALEAEVDNFRAALAWAQAQASDLYLRLGAALWPFWELRGYFTEGRTHLRHALKRSDPPHTRTRATALLGAATLAIAQGDMDEGHLFAQESLDDFRALQDARGMAASLFCLGEVAIDRRDRQKAIVLITQGLEYCRECSWLEGRASAMILLGRAEWAGTEQPDWEQIKAWIEEGLGLAEILGDSRMVAQACFRLGDLATDLYQHAGGRMRHYTSEFRKVLSSDYARARTLLSRCLEIYRRLGDRRGICRSLGTLGRLERRENPEQAITYTLEYVKIARELGIAADQAHSLHQLGSLYLQLGRLIPARDAFSEALEIYRRLHHGLGYGYARNNLGAVYFYLGEAEPARQLHREALRIYLENGMEEGILWTLERYAMVEAVYGDAAQGALLLGAVAARRERWGGAAPYEPADLEKAKATARAVLGEEAFGRTFEEGRGKNSEWAVEQVLGLDRRPSGQPQGTGARP